MSESGTSIRQWCQSRTFENTTNVLNRCQNCIVVGAYLDKVSRMFI